MTKQDLQATLGRNLRRYRTEQGLTIEQLAEKAGISITFYSNLERGNKMLSVETLRRLSNVLCVSIDALLSDREPDERTKSIEMLLQNLPTENIAFIEQLVRVCVNDYFRQKTLQEGVLVPHDAGTR